MSWQNKVVTPRRQAPPKIDIRDPCPGLFRFAGMVGFLAVGLGAYYSGSAALGLAPLDMAAPAWTGKHIGLVVGCLVLGSLAGLLSATAALMIEVRNERLNDFITVAWQFFINGGIVWMLVVGIAMSVTLGHDQAKAAVVAFGAERATIHVLATGSVLGLLIGTAFFLAPFVRIPFVVFLGFTCGVSLLAARWHFDSYAIRGAAWWVSGLIMPIVTLLIAPTMVQRDRDQRRLASEQS